MKTLIITGTYKPAGNKVDYNIVLYGQTPQAPAVQFITAFKMRLSGYDHLQSVSRAKFCKYFKTDLFNIVSMDNLNSLV